MHEQAEIVKKLVAITKVLDELEETRDDHQRIGTGTKLNQMANDLFAFYLAHMNKEESTILPLTWKYFTDDQIGAIRAKVQTSMTPERYAEWMSWMMSSVNVNELTAIFSGLKAAAPPQILEKMLHLAEKNTDRDIWNAVKTKVEL